MMVNEDSQVPLLALPVDALKAHLRMGSGFAEDAVQDEVLASFLRAALAAVEGRTGKVLIERGFTLRLEAWRDGVAEILPLAPVQSVTSVVLLDGDGAASTVADTVYRLVPDAHQPKIAARAGRLPEPVSGGAIEVTFAAGFSTDFSGLPADLQQSVLLLAAHYYEYRDETALGDGCMPFGVTSLLARYRPMRLGLAR
ncbi:head-tail connector protein [Pseudoprimorskyibacter insulae]|uniref:Phage gp6-like head-tail connector protein n=1 Tax=Pseudoprimorskyibacter insulae TaxID=1695997 RepID=A0A2R8AY97_9RHOB|nr:head-tail connector protein [Pseudoprimorskyibacter insulae]SPF80834.1 hypothetical protein PRI8871_02646 [Pseudoprimorskyibacter insulae]